MTDKPASVRIGPHPFTIEWSATSIQLKGRESGQDCFGHTEMSRMHIIIDDSRPLHGQQECLLHEIAHCLIWYANIDVPANPEATIEDREETLVGQLSGVLLDTIQRNPTVWQWLAADLTMDAECESFTHTS